MNKGCTILLIKYLQIKKLLELKDTFPYTVKTTSGTFL